MIANLQIKKGGKKENILLKVKISSICVKHALSGNEANLHSCCCLEHGYSKPKCHNLHNVHLILYHFKELHKQALEFSSRLKNSGCCQIQQS